MLVFGAQTKVALMALERFVSIGQDFDAVFPCVDDSIEINVAAAAEAAAAEGVAATEVGTWCPSGYHEPCGVPMTNDLPGTPREPGAIQVSRTWLPRAMWASADHVGTMWGSRDIAGEGCHVG